MITEAFDFMQDGVYNKSAREYVEAGIFSGLATVGGAAVNASTTLVPIAKVAAMTAVGGLSSEASQMAAYGEADRQKVAASALFSGAIELVSQYFSGPFKPSTSNTVGTTGYSGSAYPSSRLAM